MRFRNFNLGIKSTGSLVRVSSTPILQTDEGQDWAERVSMDKHRFKTEQVLMVLQI